MYGNEVLVSLQLEYLFKIKINRGTSSTYNNYCINYIYLDNKISMLFIYLILNNY